MRNMMKAALAAFALSLSACASTPPAPARVEADSALLAPRHIAMEGVYNFRDMGGYRTEDGRRVKWGLLYRSAELSHATANDIATIESFGVQQIFDLRSVEERQSEPTTWSGGEAPPIFASDYSIDRSAMSTAVRPGASVDELRAVFAASYPDLLQQTQAQQRALFDELLADEDAVLFHCTAGKDRTGMAAVLVLSALGVPRATIFSDYEMSNRYLAPPDPRMAAFGLSPEAIEVLSGVEVEYLQAAFDYIDHEYGSVDAYLERELGVDIADRQRLRALYTE